MSTREVRSKRHPELYRRAGTKVWWCRLRNPTGGRKLRQSTGHTNESAAYAEFLRRASANVVAAPTTREESVVDALSREIEGMTIRGMNPHTVDWYFKKTKALVRLLGAETLLSQITSDTLDRYEKARLSEPGSRNGTTVSKRQVGYEMHNMLFRAMRSARRLGINCPDPDLIRDRTFKPEYKPRTRWCDEDEADLLISVATPKRAAVIAFLFATGATYPSEVSPARRADIKGNIVHLHGTKRATRNRDVPVPSYAEKYLAFAVKHLPASGFEEWSNIRGDLHDYARLLSMCKPCRTARLAWGRREEGAVKIDHGLEDCKACKRTPIFEPLSPNDIRRSFGKWMRRRGIPDPLIAAAMGNSVAMVEKVYGKHDDPIAVRNLIEDHLGHAPTNAGRKAVRR